MILLSYRVTWSAYTVEALENLSNVYIEFLKIRMPQISKLLTQALAPTS
jgi:hypothetical protein